MPVAPSRRHVPASHPALRGLTPAKVRRVLEQHDLNALSAEQIADMTDLIDALALDTAHLPRQPLTVAQRAYLRVIATELLRRAT